MAKTYSDVSSEIRTYLDEAAAIDFTDAEVLRSANRSYQDVVGKVMEVNERYYDTTTPYTYAIVADQQEYTIASSLIKPTRVEINYSPTVSGSVASRAFPVDMDEIRSNLANTNASWSTSSPRYYLHGNTGSQKIGFVPVPTVADTGATKSISVWGIDLPADLTVAGDNVNIPYADRFVYLISLRGAGQLLRKGQAEEANAINYLREYDKGVIELQTFLKDRQADDMMGIIDVLGEDLDFSHSL